MLDVTLYGLDKSGGFKVWNITTNSEGILTIKHGKENGKMQVKSEAVKAKNVGKANETTLAEQAVNEAEGRIKKQVDKGYRYNKEELEELPVLPMLAGDYNKIGHRVDWTKPVFGSDKLDGVRCMAKKKGGIVTLESRTGQPYDLPHIQAELERVMDDGETYDGEIYLHGYMLQEITSAVKRTDTQGEMDKCVKAYGRKTESSNFEALEEAILIHKIRPQLQFIVFDVILDNNLDKRFEDRMEDLEAAEAVFRTRECEFLYAIWYYTLKNEGQMKQQHADCVSRGFEGVMIRNADGVYESGKRSADLQKYKTFMDSEFEIVDVVMDKEGCAVFVCQNDLSLDTTFQVIMGEKEQKQKWALTPELFIGKMLTVKYQSRYKGTLLPQFPVGLNIRDYE